MKQLMIMPIALATVFVIGGTALAAGPVDQAFVAKVSQGGGFEVLASKMAVDKAVAQDVKDFATSEVHDHTFVGDKLKAISAKEGVAIDGQPNAEFKTKLDRLSGLSGSQFDSVYMSEMAAIHAKDGAAFAQEAREGESPAYRAFAAETHKIVLRHIGAINGVAPPSR